MGVTKKRRIWYRDKAGRFVKKDSPKAVTKQVAGRRPTKYKPKARDILSRAFTAGPTGMNPPTRYEYEYATGYRDVEFTYGVAPYEDDELLPWLLYFGDWWVMARIYFVPNEDEKKKYETGQPSKYSIWSQEGWVVSYTDPKDIMEAMVDYSYVLDAIGPARVQRVQFLLYDGPQKPMWFKQKD